MQPIKKSYRIDELAREFDVSRRTIERLIERGEIQTFTVGDTRTRRIDAEEAERIKKKEPRDEGIKRI